MSGIFHVSAEQARRLLDSTLSQKEKTEVLAHLVSQCAECLKMVRDLAFPSLGVNVDYSGVLRRLKLGYIVATHDVEFERKIAAENWELMKALDSTQRLQLVKHNPRFRHWGLYERVTEEAKLLIRQDPVQSIDLTFLAILITDNLDQLFYSDSLRADFKAGALVTHANACRLLGDFVAAKAALQEAEELHDVGTGDPMERATLVSIRSSLLTDLGYFEDAEKVLQEALRISRSLRDNQLEARYTIQQSSTIGWTEPIRGLRLADRGLALLGKFARRDKALEICAVHLLALWANEAGDPQEARATFESYRYLYDQFDDAYWNGKRLHLQACIARTEGDLPQSERFFRQLVHHYEQHSYEFDLALASLDLSEVLTGQGKAGRSLEILQTLYPVLKSWELNGDILRSWHILMEGVRQHTVQQYAFKDLAMILRRKWFRKL